MASRRLVGIFGGTFDPIHHGHLRLAQEMAEALELSELRLVPAGNPPHRARPLADARHRLAMVERAAAGNPLLRVDPREVLSSAPSFTVQTLEALRKEQPDSTLCLLMGADAFRGFARWRRWEDIAAQAHLAVATRPGHDLEAGLDEAMGALLRTRRVARPADLVRSAPGSVAVVPITALDISASRIRALRRSGLSLRYLLPDAVLDYIEANGLYLDPEPA
jgi:nicotinate-nucleotide adenylyltransferase